LQLPPSQLPSREVADQMVKVYFSTIHVAYPFVSRDAFEALYPQIWQAATAQHLSDSWKATFCTFIFGIVTDET